MRRSLRSISTLIGVLLGLLALLAAGSLIVATSVLHRTNAEIAEAVESVRLGQDAQIQLLLHGRAEDPLVRRNYATRLRAAMREQHARLATTEELRALDGAIRKIEEYLVLERTDPSSVAVAEAELRAFSALERLVDVNLDHMRSSSSRSVAWNDATTVIGAILALTIVGVTIGLLVWMRRRVLRPLFSLANTVRCYGQGEREIRARVDGPDEVREMGARFNEMASALAAQRDAQAAFLGGVAHDLRNPLSAMRMAMDLIGDRPTLPPESSLRPTLRVIARQISSLDRMVSDLLDIARLETGDLELRIAEHDLRGIVSASVDLFGASARDRLRLQLPDEHVHARCDDVRIGQAVTNLISNAIKYSPPEQPIDVELERDDGEATVTVTDHGAGIPPDERARIFDPFQRGRSTDTVPGAGLGLFSVRRIVEAHHGSIEVDSAPGQGSTFRIHLPV